MGVPSWSDLTVVEAEALLAAYVAQIVPLSEAFQRRVAAAGGSDALAGDPDQLDEIVWPIVRSLRPESTDLTELLRDERTPIWARYTSGVASKIGIECSVLVAELAAFCTERVQSSAASFEWEVDRDQWSADFNRPTMVVDGRRSPCFDDQLEVLVSQFVRDDPVSREPGRISRAVFSRLAADSEVGRSRERDAAGAVLSVAAEPPGQAWTHVIEIDDVVAHEREDEVAHLVRGLRSHADVSLVIHSDREIILVATSLGGNALLELSLGLLDPRPEAGARWFHS